MRQSIFRNKAALGVLLVSLASGCVAHISEPVSPKPNETSPTVVQRSPTATQKIESDEKASGLTVYIDPKSGEFTTKPAEALPGPRGQRSLASDSSELHETLSSVPGGGVAIHLGEQFLTPLTATIDADGKLRLEHLPALPDSPDKK